MQKDEKKESDEGDDTKEREVSLTDPHKLYTDWSSWSDCNHQKYKYRSRTCKPEHPNCPALPQLTREVESCQDPGDEVLGEWINQGACQVGTRQCGAGEQMKVRQCYLDQPRLVCLAVCNIGWFVWIYVK